MLLFNMFTLLQLKVTCIDESFTGNFAVSAKLRSGIIKSIRRGANMNTRKSQADHTKAREILDVSKLGFVFE